MVVISMGINLPCSILRTEVKNNHRILKDDAIQHTGFPSYDDAKMFAKVQRSAALRQRHTMKAM